MTSPLPQLQYLVAFNDGPFADPSTLTAPAPGGTPVLGAAGTWTDITQWVAGHQITRGRQHELSQFEAGTLQLTLGNDADQFSPWNTAGPFYGLLKPMKLVQVRVIWEGTTYYRFTGHASVWQVNWQDPVSGTAELQASDAFRLFQMADLTSTGYQQQVLADGATAFWQLSDPIGQNSAADSAVPGRSGAYGGAPALGQAGPFPASAATSVQFDSSGVPNGWVEVPTASGVVGSTWTVEAWVDADAITQPNGGVSDIYSQGDTEDGLHVGVDIALVSAAGGVNPLSVSVQIGELAGLSPYQIFDTGNVFSTGSGWHHIVVVANGLNLTVYVDGTAQALTSSGSSTSPSGSIPAPSLAVIGTQAYYWFGQGTFSGNIAQVAIYNGTQLSESEVVNHYNMATFPQELPGDRVGRVLDIIRWPTGARQVDTGQSQIQEQTSSLTTTTTLSHLQSCEASEGGALFMDAQGRVTFLSRLTLVTAARHTTPQVVFGDEPGSGEIVYTPTVQPVVDDLNLWNEASGQRSGGIQQIVDNQDSIDTYGRRTWQPSGTLLNTDDSAVLGILQYAVAIQSEPQTWLPVFTVDMLDLVGDGYVGQVLGLELLDQIQVNRHGSPGGGSELSQAALVEQIQETVTPTDWQIQFQIDPTPIVEGGWFTWDESEWDDNTRWFY